MKKRTILFVVVIILISLIGAGVIMAQPKPDDLAILSSVILKEKEFANRSKNHTFNSYAVSSKDFDNQKSFVTIPFWSEGIKLTYRTNGFLDLSLKDNRQERVYIENIAYLFQTEQQATHALEQQLEMIKLQAYAPEGNPHRTASKLQSNKFGNITGQMIHLDYQEDGVEYAVYYFFGVWANRLVFLMVDGSQGIHVEETINSLIKSLGNINIEPTVTLLPPTVLPIITPTPTSTPIIQHIYLPLVLK